MLDLKLIRANKNFMSQQELSEKSGVNRNTISSIENGAVPSIQVAKKIAAVLDVDWKDFY